MADIRIKLLDKYGIDIEQTNIPSIYKVESATISSEELEEKIAKCRKKWNQTINGANEKFAKRAQGYLEKADDYEKILRDDRLRKELFQYYEKKQKVGTRTTQNESGIPFAKKYFSLLATTKRLDKNDVDFFFRYYGEERKNRKDILEMLKKEYKIVGLDSKKTEAEDEIIADGKKKNEKSALIVSRFQEATILKTHKCEEYFLKAKEEEELVGRFPDLLKSYEKYLKINTFEDLRSFQAYVSKQRDEMYALKQEKGQAYAVLVDLYNTLDSLLEYQDVVDNFAEYKIIVTYPHLTPYMYGFRDMKKESLNRFFDVANEEYYFRDLNDFITKYFSVVKDNFNVDTNGIGKIISNANAAAENHKILNNVRDAFGKSDRRKMSFVGELFYWLLYWPIFMVYFVFELCKAIIPESKKLAFPTFALCFYLANLYIPLISSFGNISVFLSITDPIAWRAATATFIGNAEMTPGDFFIRSLAYIVIWVGLYTIPTFFIADIVYQIGKSFTQRFDWLGYERTFQHIFAKLRMKTEQQYFKEKDIFVKRNLPKVVINLVCTALIVVTLAVIF